MPHPSNSEEAPWAPRLVTVPLPPVDEDYEDEKVWQSILNRNDSYTFSPPLIFSNNLPTPIRHHTPNNH